MYDNDERPRRVVITGLGTVTSIGLGVEAFLEGLRAGRSGAKPITAFDTTGFAHANGCEVDDFDPAEWIHQVDPEELGGPPSSRSPPPTWRWRTRASLSKNSGGAGPWSRWAPPTPSPATSTP